MFEERPWGDYKVLDLRVNEDGTQALTKRKRVRAGAGIETQTHHRAEVWTVLCGKCVVTLNGRAHEAWAGDTFAIGENVPHSLRAVTDVELVEIQVGKELREDGTERG
jgi:mannose-1-phosphate guanylyltransferase